MEDYLYPTYTVELEKSYKVSKFGKSLFFPKSIVIEIEEYDFEKYNHFSESTTIEVRYKFKMPDWYIKKYGIEHWNNIPKHSSIKDENLSHVQTIARSSYNGCLTIFHFKDNVIGCYGTATLDEVKNIHYNMPKFKNLNDLLVSMAIRPDEFKVIPK